ncbi:flavodoxin-dependent (E)-4-hydroxy-3-methylbut-2-enyl-diphosphate synthase [Patescibacteria group bacterium]|nr:flavodoxin-dependent (E)-4-hydroxy-3-methylbut-2-enyl-diphosphate synthase [Patescibacteria group bacterium]
MIRRKKTKKIQIGSIAIGGRALITVQSMCTTKTHDVAATVKQIKGLQAAGCEIIRVAVPNMEAAKVLNKIKSQIKIPLVADIHFDYRLALEAIKQGVDKVRINPGNIGSEDRVKAVVEAAKRKKIPIRIGVNSGSLQKDILEKYNYKVTAKGLVESALREVKILEKFKFTNIVIAIKSSDVMQTIEANTMLSKKVKYPLHLGVTEAGTPFTGMTKSAIGLGTLLFNGIGDTIRVSLTADPVEEVKAGWEILKALDIRQRGPKIISCPTCGRTEINLINLANQVEEAVKGIKQPIKIAVMGCVVNGPGEAREADIGVAGGVGCGAIFKKGKVIKTVKEKEILSALLEEIDRIIKK